MKDPLSLLEYLAGLSSIHTFMMLKLTSYRWLVADGEVLKKIRIYVYIVTLCHQVILSVYLLNKDFSKSDDPNLQQYVRLKWRLITTWFNLLHIPYIITSIYCEWHDVTLESQPRYLRLLNKGRNFIFNSIILPVTVSSDIMFWQLYYKDRRLLMPLSTDEFISIRDHHSMHTYSLIFVLFDLICVPRKRPKNMRTELTALTVFLTSYLSVNLLSAWNEDYVYPFLKMLSMYQILLLAVFVYIANFFYYMGQWFIVDFVWGQRGERIKTA